MGILPIIWVLLLFCAFDFAQTEECPKVCSCLGNHVDCSSRNLHIVPPNLPSWAETLELQHNVLSNLDSAFSKLLPNLQKLDLSSNNIQSVPSSIFDSFPAIENLNLRKNRLTQLPNDLTKLPYLKRLDLRSNEIERIDESSLNHASHVTLIDLSRNALTDWPGVNFDRPVTVEFLYLDGNRISSLHPQALDNFSSLKELKLARNKLKHVQTDSFKALGNLTLLDLSRNKFRRLGGLTFRGLSKLLILKLNKNLLRTLEDGTFYGLTSLRTLLLNNNKLTEVSKGWVFGVQSLERLDLSSNEISTVDPESWGYCPGLKVMDLAVNLVEKLGPKSFKQLSELRELLINENNLKQLTNSTFFGLAKLELLDMSSNHLSSIIEDSVRPFAVGLPSLKTLSLANNGLQALPPQAFHGIDDLTALDLSRNQFTTLDRTAFFGLNYLTDLRLNTSSLLCDCKLDWFGSWIKDRSLTPMIDDVICDHPPPLSGLSVMDINPENLTCDDSPKPSIIEQPLSQIGLKNNNATFTCVASASKDAPITVEWKRNAQLLYAESGSVHISKVVESLSNGMVRVKSDLLLVSLREEDKAQYQCIVTNKYGAAYSLKAGLSVHVYPSFAKSPVNITLESGQTAKLECKASGFPIPQLRWQKDGGTDFPAATERRMHVLPQDDVFFIVNVKVNDAGMYTCTANNQAGEVKAHATLVVLEKPLFRRPLADKTANAGQTVVMDCSSNGSPQPEIEWTLNDHPLPQSERYSLTAVNQLLVVVKVRQSDGGIYKCTLKNGLGQTSQQAQLTVIGDYDGAKLGNGTDGPEVGVRPPDTDGQWFPFDPASTLGIAVIVVVGCVVATSLIWVTVIWCRTRKPKKTKAPYASVAKDELFPEISGPSRSNVFIRNEGRGQNDYSNSLRNYYENQQASAPESSIDRFLAFSNSARRAPLPDDNNSMFSDQHSPVTPSRLDQTSSLDSGVQDVTLCPLLQERNTQMRYEGPSLMQISTSGSDYLADAKALGESWTEEDPNGDSPRPLRTFARRKPPSPEQR